jgi:RND family efflux transporter MFP subunit
MLPALFTTLKKPFVWFWYIKKRYKIGISILFLIVSAVIFSQIHSAATPPPYKTAEAKKTDITEIVSESGNITVTGRVTIYSPTNGIVEDVFVKNGESVTVGQELVRIKSSATEQEKAAAWANYLTAKSSVDTANATLHVLQSDLFAANKAFVNGAGTKEPLKDDPNYVIQNADWLAAEANYKKQQGVIASAQAAATAASLAYQATQNAIVKATADGVVSNLSVSPLSSVQATSPTAPTQPLLTISNLAVPEVIVKLSENDVAKVAEGQKVIVDVSAIQDKTYTGIVRRVDSIGTDDKGVIRYTVYIEILNPDSKLRPGMNVDVKIVTQMLSSVLSVPNAAVKPYKGGRAVRIPGAKKGEVIYKSVTIGVKGERRTQIISGIKQGQLVITSLTSEQNKRPGPFGG